MKEIVLVPDTPLYNYVDVAVMDFPKGREDGTQRRRCVIRMEFSRYDVGQLQKQGMDMDAAMRYYEDYLYKVVKMNLASDWKCVDGWDQVMNVVRENVARFY